ncbi:MAG: Zn-dependent alcohol dehydrogenase [Pseudomonadota bacterium]|nr:Zn-dependent alcohol dehydrogenase [Pseudomonadota bacterium]
MKAALYRAADKPIQVEDVELGSVEPNEVLVDLEACGVCHSDLHVMHMLPQAPVPIILGHEAAGVVKEVGGAVSKVQPGDHVIIAFYGACGHCFYCVKGMRQLCCNRDIPARQVDGERPRITANGMPVMQGVGVGGWAHQVLLPESSIIKIRNDAPLDKVSLIGCGVMTGVGAAIHTAKVEAGSDVAVIGCGGVGLNIIQGARLAGANRIIAVDLLPNKLEMAREFGATHCVNGKDGDPVEQVKAIAPTLDYAFEAIGLGATVQQAFAMIRPGGTAVVVGVGFGKTAEIPLGDFLQEKKLIGSIYGSGQVHVDIPRLVDLYMEGKLALDPLISQVRPLSEVNEALRAMEAGEVARTLLSMKA